MEQSADLPSLEVTELDAKLCCPQCAVPPLPQHNNPCCVLCVALLFSDAFPRHLAAKEMMGVILITLNSSGVVPCPVDGGYVLELGRGSPQE